ncbi:uncharacterized protein LOC105421972 isoform X2 [Pogonomyrmex barbatus]|uniref:Uncharacterized protein LOC105421972 isoform X2 n=1 Tax=Pogonomyrmex barbatus TaxID=144034 RepID=A0A6I9VM17_9HYME|nr:uncharacterized protein LOC105421972 isoform X2 [Pogonomyrmex barbatus]
MKDSRLGSIMLFIIFLIFVGASDAKPLDYEDVANLLPTEPQTTNDTLTAIVQDPVVQDAVQNAVGNGSLEGLVVKKKVLVMPATEPNKESKDSSSYASQRNDFYETLTEISKTTRKPTFPIDNIPQEIPYLVSNPSQEIAPSEPPPVISVPIIAFLDPAKISNDKIDVPIVALSQDETLKNQMENERDKIQRNIQNYVDTSSLSVDLDNWRLTSFPSEMQVSPSLYESSIKETRNANNVSPENSLSVLMPRVDIVTPLFWTSDADINYSKDPHDMEVAADIVFRPLFRYRQEAQQRSYRRSTYRRYNSYNSYPRRNYRYRPRYSDYYY